jgi:PBP1b-binding outer membrane lipoprotein LpoB
MIEMKTKIVLAMSLAVFLSACGNEKSTEEQTAKAVEETSQVEENTNVATETDVDNETTEPKAETVVSNVDMSMHVEAAKKGIMVLGSNLKGELTTAMKAGGPVEAIAVCNEKAPEIAKQISAQNSMSISRTSMKNRNPENAPTAWQAKVLQEFETRKANGEDLKTMAYSEVVEHEGKQEFRFMKAIPTGAVCLNCHGADIKPAVMEKIQALYPEDKATGFSEGDIRGAFVVTKSL